MYLDNSQAKAVTRAEKKTEFRDGSYNNGYRDNNNYLEKFKTYYDYNKRDKRRDRFLDSQE